MNLVVQGGVPRCLCEWMSRKLINRDEPGASRLQMYYCARAALPAKWFMPPARTCKFTPFLTQRQRMSTHMWLLCSNYLCALTPVGDSHGVSISTDDATTDATLWAMMSSSVCVCCR
jgi:hypothetical protein